jgi:hypothetical protein
MHARLRLRLVALLALAVSASGCLYGFSSGTGLTGVETMAIIPCENDTDRLELTAELYDIMFRRLPNQLGLVVAGEGDADVIVRCAITGYDLSTPNYRAGANPGDAPEVLQREVRVRAGVQIVDPRQELILWEDMGLTAEGQFLEASETEEVGKLQALDLLVQRMIDGAQSNW